MRFLTSFLLLSAGLVLAQPPAEVGPPRFSLGIGLVVSDNAYAGQERELLPIPMMNYRRGGFSFQGIRAAYDFLQQPSQTLSVALQPRFESFEADDSEALLGMADRKKSLDLGLGYRRRFGATEVGVDAFFDVLDRSGGYELEFSLAQRRRLGRWLFQGRLGLAYRDEDNTAYYYGVRLDEATATRPAYTPDAAWTPSLGLRVMRPLGKRGWMAMVAWRSAWLPATVRDSPIVDQTRLSMIMSGLSYRFR